jgi:hypothetical protein
VNAVLEEDSSKLDKVAVVRLCGPYTESAPPFGIFCIHPSHVSILIIIVDFPPALRRLVEGYSGYVDGGYQGKVPRISREQYGGAYFQTTRLDL